MFCGSPSSPLIYPVPLCSLIQTPRKTPSETPSFDFFQLTLLLATSIQVIPESIEVNVKKTKYHWFHIWTTSVWLQEIWFSTCALAPIPPKMFDLAPSRDEECDQIWTKAVSAFQKRPSGWNEIKNSGFCFGLCLKVVTFLMALFCHLTMGSSHSWLLTLNLSCSCYHGPPETC